MDQLPQELLRLIAQNVTHDDLEPLRLVNQPFAAAAAPFLFEDIPLWIGFRSLQRLTAIAKHSQLSRYPKRIFFSPLRFIDFCDIGVCEIEGETWLETQNAPLGARAPLVAKYKSAYSSYLQAQRSLSFNGMDVKILSRAFSQLPRLETLYFDYWDTTIGAAELKHVFGPFKAQGLLTCDGEYTLPTVVQALAASSIKIRVFKLGGDVDSYSSISGSDEDYSKAASITMPHLEVDDDGYRPFEISDQALLNAFGAEKLDINMNAFRGLRELKITPIRYFSIVEPPFAALQNLMQCVPDLEILTLEPTDGLALGNMMPFIGFNRLKELNLRYLEINIVALNDLLCRNKSTIVKADFYCVAITRSHWSTALVQLRTIDLPQLEVFNLDCFPVHDYVLRRTDTNPLVEKMKSKIFNNNRSWLYSLAG